MLKRTSSLFGILLLGAIGLWIGMPNALGQIPVAVLGYPAALLFLSKYAADHSGIASAFRMGWLCGLIGSSAAMYWIAVPVHDVALAPWFLAIPCALALGAYVGLYGGIFAVLLCWLLKKSKRNNYQNTSSDQKTDQKQTHPHTDKLISLFYSNQHISPWIFATFSGLLWYLLEWFRGWFLTGFPWLTLSAAFAPWAVMIQSTAVIGAYGLSGLLVGLLCLFMPFSENGRKKRYILAAGLVILLIGGGWLRLFLAGSCVPSDTDPLLVLVQGNIDQNVKWESAMQEATVRDYLYLSEKSVAEKNPDLVIWPETAMPFAYDRPGKKPFSLWIREFTQQYHTALLFGSPAFHRLSPEKEKQIGERYEVFNRAYLVSDSGKDCGYYEKEHLVPFGEYLPPWLDFSFLRPLLQGVGNFAPGDRHGTLKFATQNNETLTLGLLICYEMIFPEIARNRVADGATVLMNISNDAWFGFSSAPKQHLDLGLLRAVEQGRWLARATNTGISAFIDPYGRLHSSGGLFTKECLLYRITPLHDHTPFYYAEPWLPRFALLFLLLTGFALRRQPKNF